MEHTFCSIFLSPQYNSCINVRSCPICMNHFTPGHLLISECFRGGFIFTVEQSLLICYFTPIDCSSWLAKRTVQDETQQHKTHNNQHEMPPPCPPAALPSPSMGRTEVPPTHDATASYGPMLVACGLVWRCHGQFLCLEH